MLLMMGTELSAPRQSVRSPSTAVVEAVANAEECDPADLKTPLYDHVDPDALDAFVASPADSCVRFEYHGYEVRIDGDGGVTIVGTSD